MSGYENVVKAWRDRNITDANTLDNVLSNFRVVFAYHSGAIENDEITYHQTREIFENGKIINFTGNLRTIFEIQNQKVCYDFLKCKIIAKEPITAGLIKEIHFYLMNGCYDEVRYGKGERPGLFKINDYCVADGQGALPADVPNEIDELCDELRDIPDRGDNIIKAAAYIHCKFENIHPFADGNGRVGRTLMNYYLMIREHPPLVVRNDTKEQYYHALRTYDQTGEVDEFVDYMKAAVEKTWELHSEPKKRLVDLLME